MIGWRITIASRFVVFSRRGIWMTGRLIGRQLLFGIEREVIDG